MRWDAVLEYSLQAAGGPPRRGLERDPRDPEPFIYLREAIAVTVTRNVSEGGIASFALADASGYFVPTPAT